MPWLLFFLVEKTRAFGNLLSIIDFKKLKHLIMLDICSYMLSCLQIQEIESMAMFMWSIWTSRNKWVMEGKRELEEDIIYKAHQILEEFRAANDTETQNYNRNERARFWSPPLEGFFKVNVDMPSILSLADVVLLPSLEITKEKFLPMLVFPKKSHHKLKKLKLWQCLRFSRSPLSKVFSM